MGVVLRTTCSSVMTFSPARPSQHVPYCVMLSGALMLCVDMRFADWFGLTPGDCLGKPFASLGVESDAVTE